MRSSLRDFLPWTLLLLLFSKQVRALVVPRSSAPPPGSGIIAVPKVHTGGPSWQPDRFAALAKQGITGDVARAIVAHWGFETGWGAGEWNWNVGNRIALAGEKGADIGAQWNKAYDSLGAGVSDYLALLHMPRYAMAWTVLQGAPRSTAWVKSLVKSGYATLDADEYEKRYAKALERLA